MKMEEVQKSHGYFKEEWTIKRTFSLISYNQKGLELKAQG